MFPSPLVPVLKPATEYAAASFPPRREVLAGAVELMHRIRTEFKYDPKATVISTPLTEVLEKRHGVCQDFAHVMIAGLRGLGLPAAYVSGYLRTIPPPGKPRLQGADATHAWVSLWCGEEIGWIGLRSDQRRPDRATITSCSRSAATFPTSRRSTASSSDHASRSSAWPSTWCRWNSGLRTIDHESRRQF